MCQRYNYICYEMVTRMNWKMVETSKATSPVIVPSILTSPLSVELVPSFSKFSLIIAVPHIVSYSKKAFHMFQTNFSQELHENYVLLDHKSPSLVSRCVILIRRAGWT